MPPIAVAASAAITRGDRVQVPLGIHGPPRSVTYSIRQRPQHGTLSAIASTGDATASVEYRSEPNSTASADQFTYVARSPSGVSAPASVTITIIDPPSRLDVPNSARFGEVFAGQPATLSLSVTNVGGGVARGELEIDAPFRLEDTIAYAIPAGRTAQCCVALDTSRSGTFSSTLRFTGHPGVEIALSAVVLAPITASPISFSTTAPRSATLLLTNVTDAPRSAELVLGSRIRGPRQLDLPPGETVPAKLSLDPADLASLAATVTVLSEGFQLELIAHADAIPPRLIVPEVLDLGPTAHGARQAATVTATNAGGERVFIEPSVAPPFALVDDGKGATLEPGASASWILTGTAPGPGQAEADLVWKAYANKWTTRARITGTGAWPIAMTAPSPSPSPSAPQPSPSLVLPQADRPTIRAGAIRDLRTNRATIAWDARRPPEGGSARVEIRLLSLDANRQLEVRWQPFDFPVIWESESVAAATLLDLQPGVIHTVRLVVFGPGAAPLGQSVPLTFSTRPPWRPSAKGIAIAVGLLALAALATLRIRAWLAWHRRMYGPRTPGSG